MHKSNRTDMPLLPLIFNNLLRCRENSISTITTFNPKSLTCTLHQANNLRIPLEWVIAQTAPPSPASSHSANYPQVLLLIQPIQSSVIRLISLSIGRVGCITPRRRRQVDSATSMTLLYAYWNC